MVGFCKYAQFRRKFTERFPKNVTGLVTLISSIDESSRTFTSETKCVESMKITDFVEFHGSAHFFTKDRQFYGKRHGRERVHDCMTLAWLVA